MRVWMETPSMNGGCSIATFKLPEGNEWSINGLLNGLWMGWKHEMGRQLIILEIIRWLCKPTGEWQAKVKECLIARGLINKVLYPVSKIGHDHGMSAGTHHFKILCNMTGEWLVSKFDLERFDLPTAPSLLGVLMHLEVETRLILYICICSNQQDLLVMTSVYTAIVQINKCIEYVFVSICSGGKPTCELQCFANWKPGHIRQIL